MEINWPENVPQSEINMRFVQGMANALATSFLNMAKCGISQETSLTTRQILESGAKI